MKRIIKFKKQIFRKYLVKMKKKFKWLIIQNSQDQSKKVSRALFNNSQRLSFLLIATSLNKLHNFISVSSNFC